jgi:hypothetical protein
MFFAAETRRRGGYTFALNIQLLKYKISAFP